MTTTIGTAADRVPATTESRIAMAIAAVRPYRSRRRVSSPRAPRLAFSSQEIVDLGRRYLNYGNFHAEGESTMPHDRDGKHAGGSIVDTPQANTSPEQIKKDNEARAREREVREADGRDDDAEGRDAGGRRTD